MFTSEQKNNFINQVESIVEKSKLSKDLQIVFMEALNKYLSETKLETKNLLENFCKEIKKAVEESIKDKNKNKNKIEPGISFNYEDESLLDLLLNEIKEKMEIIAQVFIDKINEHDVCMQKILNDPESTMKPNFSEIIEKFSKKYNPKQKYLPHNIDYVLPDEDVAELVKLFNTLVTEQLGKLDENLAEKLIKVNAWLQKILKNPVTKLNIPAENSEEYYTLGLIFFLVLQATMDIQNDEKEQSAQLLQQRVNSLYNDMIHLSEEMKERCAKGLSVTLFESLRCHPDYSEIVVDKTAWIYEKWNTFFDKTLTDLQINNPWQYFEILVDWAKALHAEDDDAKRKLGQENGWFNQTLKSFYEFLLIEMKKSSLKNEDPSSLIKIAKDTFNIELGAVNK